MAIELARTQVLPRPWGVVDLRLWNNIDNAGIAFGEIWYERPGRPLLSPALLFKLLFTSQPLERIDLVPNSIWCLEAKRQTRLLVLSGGGVAGSIAVAAADAVFASRTMLTFTPASSARWASLRTRAWGRFRTYCRASPCRARRN
jgi:hypothetical protein